MTTKAKAWQFRETGGPEKLEVIEHELPDPGPGEALVRFEAIGPIRADLLELAGVYFGPPPSPSFLGQEAVGVIESLGPEVVGSEPVVGPLAVGDRVGLMVGRIDHRGMGTYRTAGIYPRSTLLPLPENLSFAEGAGLWLNTLTALTGLDAGHVTPETGDGKTVLITAASSGVGVVALQAARALGATTVASTTSQAKAERLGELADHVVVAPDPDALVEGVSAVTDGRGVDLAFDPVGYDYAPALMKIAAQDGHVVVYGLLSGTAAPLDLHTMIFKDVGLHGFTVHRIQRDPELLERMIGVTLDLVESHKLKPVVAATYGFDEAPAALVALSRNEHFGKIVVAIE
ncbi:MAG: zinc-binding dehydrogenase [Thermoanaerobaculales bacterium]|nr:zinc-binding dehydrogenase [Thermoanaerobaculales bacterium]